MKSLESWAPEWLKRYYQVELDKLTQENLNPKQKETQSKRARVLYRLGTHQEMKDVWGKLLIKDAKEIKYLDDKELALVDGICGLIGISISGEKLTTPLDKGGQLQEISDKIQELQRLIRKSTEASSEDGVIVETILHKINVEYRNSKGEKIAPQSPNYLKHIDINANSELSTLSLDEHMPWKERTQVQRLGWWTREATTLNLTDILSFYSERMNDYSENYKYHYAKNTSKLSRGLSWLMEQLYGKPFDDYVAKLLNVILDTDSWDKDKVRKIRAYQKSKSK
jgi:hypothetical protein